MVLTRPSGTTATATNRVAGPDDGNDMAMAACSSAQARQHGRGEEWGRTAPFDTVRIVI